MAYASIAGRAKTNPHRPAAHAICDRCGFRYNLVDLAWEMEWRGNDLMRTGFRVCTRTCLDIPFQNNRPLYLPPDPPPVEQPRVEAFIADENATQLWDQSGEFYDEGLNWDEPA